MATIGQKYGISGNQRDGYTFTGNVRPSSQGPGRNLYVDTLRGGSGTGATWDGAFATMAEALSVVTEAVIYVTKQPGDSRYRRADVL